MAETTFRLHTAAEVDEIIDNLIKSEERNLEEEESEEVAQLIEKRIVPGTLRVKKKKKKQTTTSSPLRTSVMKMKKFLSKTTEKKAEK